MGVDVSGVDVLGVDFTALIPWENGSEQGMERIMSDAVEEHDGKVSISSRNIINLQFTEEIDAVAEEEQEQETLVESLNKPCTRYKMDISADEIKLMTNSSNAIQTETKVKGAEALLSTSEQLFQIMAQNLKFSQGLCKPLQLLQSFWMIKGEADALCCHFHIFVCL